MVSPIRFLVLTEDSGDHAQPTIRTLLKRSLQHLEASLDTSRLNYLPHGDNEATRANAWKGPCAATPRLLREIADALVNEAFVVFHVDADVPWSDRTESENRRAFERTIREGVVAALTTARIHRGVRTFDGLPRNIATELVAKLMLMSPCYSIESWLYQARETVARHCNEEHAGKQDHAELLESWSDRTKLDEVMKPKDTLDCVADKHNATLATEFPAREVDAAERSYSEFVNVLRAAPGLLAALQPEAH